MLAEASMLVVLTVHHGSGTDGCLDQQQLAQSVEKRLKRRVFVAPPEANLRFVVTFAKTSSGTQASIAIASIDGTSRGTRTLVTDGHCSALDDSLALSLALLADQPPDPEPDAEKLPPEPGEAPPPAPPVAVTPTPTPAPLRPKKTPITAITIPREVAAPREPWHVGLGAAASGSWGILPGVAPSFAAYLRFVPRGFFPILVEGEGFLPRTLARDETSGAHVQLWRAGLAVCPRLSEGPTFGVGVCVGQKVGRITAQGYGFDHDHEDHRVNYSVLVGGEGRLRLFTPISLRGYLGAEVALARSGFASSGENSTRLFRPAPVAVYGQIGLEAALW